MADSVLVTGGAGYLGSILCAHLLQSGFRVTVLDNLLYGEQSLFHLCAEPRFTFVHGDVRDEQLVRRLTSEADILIPLAAIVGAPACDRDPALAGQSTSMRSSTCSGVAVPRRLVVFPTTNSGYGTGSGLEYCTEETPLEPISLYGRTKVQAKTAVLHEPQHHHSSPGHGLRHVAPDACCSTARPAGTKNYGRRFSAWAERWRTSRSKRGVSRSGGAMSAERERCEGK